MQTEKEEEKPDEQAPAVEATHEDAFRASIDELKAEVGELRKALTARPQAKIADIDAAAGRREEPRLTKEALAKMTQAEIARLDWNEVRRVLSAG
ncbi:MAG: hypothetical protein K1X52_05565 [Pyrinomonadaceae bacterium]|nr:hypothetical protein [Pyrinomonadaceae bacterium]